MHDCTSYIFVCICIFRSLKLDWTVSAWEAAESSTRKPKSTSRSYFNWLNFDYLSLFRYMVTQWVLGKLTIRRLWRF